jgi:hypothetical protein
MFVNVTSAQFHEARHLMTFEGTHKEDWARDQLIQLLIRANRENGGNYDPRAPRFDPIALKVISAAN